MAYSDKTFQQISKEHNVSEGYLGDLNKGARFNPKFSYPLRKPQNTKLLPEKAIKVTRELLYTTKSTEQIARDNNVGSATVWYINNGKKYVMDGINYPIRMKGTKYSHVLIDAVISELKDNKHDFRWIEQTYNISHSTLSRLNNGKILVQPNITYPIRSSKQRVYNPVETIPSEIGSRVIIDT